MKISRENWAQELLGFLTAPSFFVYCIGLLIAVLAVILPDFMNATDITVAEGDSMGFMAARYFASTLGSILMFLPAFAVSVAPARDKERIIRGQKLLRNDLDSRSAVLVRVASEILLMFIPLLVAASIMMSLTADKTGCLNFLGICFTWLLPTLVFAVGLSSVVTEWTGLVWPGILVSIIVWVFTQGSTADLADYNSCVAVRHELLGGFAEYSANTGALAANRIIVLLIGVVFIILASIGLEWKRNHTR